MSIKPVLVPDHDAAALRGLIDRFADATTGPVKRQLTESVESGVTEGVKKCLHNSNMILTVCVTVQ